MLSSLSFKQGTKSKFLPPASATTAYANGGRIGYDSGGYVPLQ